MDTFRERWKKFKAKKIETLHGSLSYNSVKARHEHTGLEVDQLYRVIEVLTDRIERLEDGNQ